MSKTRQLRDIARDIRLNWKNPYFGAIPYLGAMSSLGDIKENYGQDSADHIVRYFLGNAGTWRGEDARRIKKELNGMLK